MNIIEFLGIIASIFVLWSLSINTAKKPLFFRILSLIGGLLFLFYGIKINSISVSVVNFILIIINIYYILKIKNYLKKD